MARQIIRLTESDLHRIIKESVKKVIKEQEEDLEAQYKAACAKVKALKGKGDKKAFFAAAQEMNSLKEKLGKTKTIKLQQGKSLPGQENDNSGTELKRTKEGGKHKHDHPWNVKTNIMKDKREMDKEDFGGIKGVKANNIDDALVGGN